MPTLGLGEYADQAVDEKWVKGTERGVYPCAAKGEQYGPSEAVAHESSLDLLRASGFLHEV